ncbi:hypothetical protein [Flavobacterium aestivum]|uniref:hypothetical protein n=1 Tax=Flavobacterium aestivum TaxID=3003257 RepID=UPI002482C256|nr:hypothetical protein [Flavobacterium aestivum]
MNADSLLHRTLLGGQEYEPLFPKVSSQRRYLGNGNTFVTVQLMQKWIAKHNYQTKKIAKLLQRDTLKETCDRIYWFLYNHIQYKADKLNQDLQSPSYAFEHRAIGMDCKSYSVFASCILVNLGIKHYIRQIRQPSWKPELFTHVYVIVPLNQATADIKDGYLVIDATTSNNREPIYVMAEDTEVNLPHYGLNAPRPARKAFAKKTKTFAKKESNLGIYAIIGGIIGGAFVFGKKN